MYAPIEVPDSSDLQEVAGRIEEYYQAHQAWLTPFAREIEENILFLLGHHWTDVDPRTGTYIPSLRQKEGSQKIPKPVANYIYTTARTVVSEWAKNLPLGSVHPSRNDDKSRSKTRLAEAARLALWDLLDEDIKYGELFVWLLCGGFAFKKDFIDYTRASLVTYGYDEEAEPPTFPDGTEIRGADGEPIDFAQARPTGDRGIRGTVDTEIVTPLQMVWDLTAPRFERSRWNFEWSVRSKRWVEENYDLDEEGYTGRAKDVKAEEHLSVPLMILHRLRMTSYTTAMVGAPSLKDSVVVKEYYEVPSKKHKQGRMVVVANGVPLYSGKTPYLPYRWHPYTRFDDFPYPVVMPRPRVSQAKGLNRSVNGIDSFAILHRHTVLAPKTFVPKGSGLARGQISGLPGGFYEFNPNSQHPPQVVQPQPITAELQAERATKVEDIRETMGAQRIQTGDTPKGVPSYAGLGFLREQATDAHTITMRRLERSFRRSEIAKLQLLSTFHEDEDPAFTAKILTKLTGASSAEIQTFVGEDIEANTDVIVEAGTSVATSHVLTQETVHSLLKEGILAQEMQDPRMRQRILEILGVGMLAGADSNDVVKAEAENAYYLGGGRARLISPSDNDILHLRVHDDERKRLSWFDLPEEDRAALQMHINEHLAQMQQKAMQNPSGMAAATAQSDIATGATMPGSEGQARPVSAVARGVMGGEPAPGMASPAGMG